MADDLRAAIYEQVRFGLNLPDDVAPRMLDQDAARVTDAIMKLVRATPPICQMCHREEATIVECRQCNHWANMED